MNQQPCCCDDADDDGAEPYSTVSLGGYYRRRNQRSNGLDERLKRLYSRAPFELGMSLAFDSTRRTQRIAHENPES
jgi:hypothetical protein